MKYLLLAVLSIIVYAEVLPTVSVLFEWIRTIIIAKTALIQQKTIHIQEDIQNTQDRLKENNVSSIGFDIPSNDLDEEDEYEE